MKTIVNNIRFALLLGFIALGMTALAQAIPNYNKMSITTQMFLDEMAGRISLDESAPLPDKFNSPGKAPRPRTKRPIASPDTVNGEVYISATVRITNESDIQELEAMGVIIQCKFQKGLLTTLIPVDKIEQVATIDGVKRINVSAIMRPLTNVARQRTNVDDVLTLSQDARNAGLLKAYDGSGVILGVIDDGIDFQHKAFTDKNGNTRLVRAYCYNGNTTTEWTGSGNLPTTDDSGEDHGTHTSSIAGGSSVVVSGSNVTVTDDHSIASYGGMAPGADLFLAGTQLYTNHILNSFQRMSDYADAQGKPLVVSNSWGGSALYPHDGNNDMSDVLDQYFGDDKPNHICLFASGNEANMADGGQGGGRFLSGSASQASPLGTILRTVAWEESYYRVQYFSGWLTSAWTRGTDCTGIGINIHVINKSTGALRQSYSYNSTTASGSYTSVTLNDIGNMSIRVYFDYIASSGKHQVALQSRSNPSTSNYVIAVEVYPIGGTNSVIDIYGGDDTYLTGYLTTSGHNWQYGTDDLSMGDEAMDPNVISVGAYVTRNGTYSTGDISDFSSYAVEGIGPTGAMHPWITAPGEVLVSAYNHYVSHSSSELTVNNSTAPYGEMSGTSMATPAAAGIVALWLQAAHEQGMDLTLSDVKDIMRETAIRDSWVTTGPHASHFGNGKIDALAGIEYILRGSDALTITASPTTVTFTADPYGSYTQTVTVTGRNLTDGITATLDDPNGVYSISTTTLGNSGGELVITYTPGSLGSHTATITLTSPGAPSVTITINGTSSDITEATFGEDVYISGVLPVYGYWYDTNQHNQMLYPASWLQSSPMTGKKLKSMTFYPTTGTTNNTTYSGINFYEGNVTFKLANMPANTAAFPETGGSAISNAAFTTVATVVPVVNTSATTWKITFDEGVDFTYNGGDLLIDVVTTAGQYSYSYFRVGETTALQGFLSMTANGQAVAQGLDFLPTVTFEWEAPQIPITAGSVSPTTVTFTNSPMGDESVQTVTISNTGNQPFTPVIDTTGLPSEFTVSGSGQVTPGGTLDLTVTYIPTDEGPHSGTFTVTIGEHTYTVTVSGNGVNVTSTLTSNEVMVPVYKSDIRFNDKYIFTIEQVNNDNKKQLEYGDGDGDISILVKSDEAITGYDLSRKLGENGSWTTAGSALHQGDSYVAGSTTLTFGDGETEMWFPMNDNTAVSGIETYYVPVTVADGVITTGNTYGAPISSKEGDNVNLTVRISGSKSDQRVGGHWTYWTPQGDSVEYCVYTTIVDIFSEELDGVHHKPYKFRAWVTTLGDHPIFNFDRNSNGAIVGTTTLETPYLLGELTLGENEFGQHVVIGEEWNPNSGVVKMQNAFGAPSNGAQISVVVRAYYQKGDSPTMLRGSRDDDGYAFSEAGGNDPYDLPTGVIENYANREIVDVTYVNALGISSSRPFEGMNIVVTRYSDGSISTTKVLKR